MILIFVTSSLSKPPDPPAGLSDKTAHAFVYAILGALILRGLVSADWKGVTLKFGAVAVLFSALYGLSDEFHQSFVEGRVADVVDLIADTIGAFIGVTLVWALSVVRVFRQTS